MNGPAADVSYESPRLSVVIPARDEALCITSVIAEWFAQRDSNRLLDLLEIVVADNGSRDGTGKLARVSGARVIEVAQPGYGRACWEGAQYSRGSILMFVDGDGAVDPSQARLLLQRIDEGADLVIGVRERAAPGSMTAPQRFGNWLACALIRTLWPVPAPDLGPFCAIRRDAFDALRLRDRSFGWTVEMQVRAHAIGLRVAYCPVAWRRRVAGRSKVSGTVSGVFNAGVGILGMIAKLWLRERRRPRRETDLFHRHTNSPYTKTPS